MSLEPDLVAFLLQAQRALDSEAAAIKDGASITASAGVRLRTTAGGTRYAFQLESDNAYLCEGPVLLVTGAATSKATLDRIDGCAAIVTSARDFGARPGRTVIASDTLHLVERLQELLRSYENGSAPFHETLVRETLGFVAPREAPSTVVSIPADLHADQAEVVRGAATLSTTFVQGPPGTGKSTTLGAGIAEQARQGERVLVVATSNVAVDNCVSKVLDRVRPEQLGSSSAILRVGPSVDLTPEEEEAVCARVLAERELPTAARPSVLTTLREAALRPVEEIDVVRSQGALAAVPQETAVRWLDELAAAVTMLSLAGAAALAAAAPRLDDDGHGAGMGERTPKAARRRQRRPQRPRRSTYDEILGAIECSGLPDGPGLRASVARFVSALKAFDAVLGRLKIVVDRIERGLISEARIVAATLAKATITDVIAEGWFDVVVFDEVSMANLAQVVAVAGRAKRAVVLCGDYRQIAPIAATKDSEAKEFLERDVFVQTGIVAAVDAGKDDPRLRILTRQFRMHPDIARAPSKLNYSGRLVTDKSVLKRPTRPLPFLRGKSRVAVVDTSRLGPWSVKEPGSHSRFNPMHCGVTAAVVAQLRDAGYAPADIGVVTPHRAHARLLQRVLEDNGLGAVTASTVHRFQGLEREAIVLDLADCPPAKVSQLLRTSPYFPEDFVRRILNVAVTRARDALVLVMNWPFLKASCPAGSPLSRLLAEPGYGSPFSDPGAIVAGSSLGRLVAIHGGDGPARLPSVVDGDATLVVGRADVVGLLRVLDLLGRGVRTNIIYRAEGAIGAANAAAITAALDGTDRNVVAVGLDALLADALVCGDVVHAYAAPPWDLRSADHRSMTIAGAEFVEEVERLVRVDELLAMAGDRRGVAKCSVCGATLVVAVRHGRVRRRCGCKEAQIGARAATQEASAFESTAIVGVNS